MVQSIKNSVAFVFIIAMALLPVSSCKTAETTASGNQAAAAGGVKAGSPTEAYKMLYAAVKAKDSARIRQMMSKNTVSFAGMASEKQKQTVEKVMENGFLETTFAPAPPEMRDERVRDNFGAVEVFNTKKNTWEDTNFVKEDGGWKLAVGDIWNGAYKSPGKGRAQLEMEASGGAMGKMIETEPDQPDSRAANKNTEVKTIEVPTPSMKKND